MAYHLSDLEGAAAFRSYREAKKAQRCKSLCKLIIRFNRAFVYCVPALNLIMFKSEKK